MESLRRTLERDLYDALESEWKMPVELTSPDGVTQIYSANNPSELLGGQVLYSSRRESPETGETIIVNQPVITLRVSSLVRIPKAGEKWYIKIPTGTESNAVKQSFVFTPDRSPENGTDMGFIKLYLQKISSEVTPIS
jgi:hypothetical protein